VLALAPVSGGLLGVRATRASPAPAPQSCDGQIIAWINQASDQFGASGNPEAASGLGYFRGPKTATAIAAVRDEISTSA
jgi:hypothetical protein